MSAIKMSPGKTVKIAQRMVSSREDFDAAIGAALLHGTFKNQRKLIVSFESTIEKYMY